VNVGYSGKPLIEKLGIKHGARAMIVAAPRVYLARLGRLPTGVRLVARGAGPFDFIQIFATSSDHLKARFSRARTALASAGMLWASWPKRASGVPTDLDESVVRRAGLSLGLVDVKICAVDETWSALKFVIPLKSR
jgi:hypothetical protein